MTSFPPILPVLPDVLDVVDELLDELPPQAATSTPTTADKMTHLKRFIDILVLLSAVASSYQAQGMVIRGADHRCCNAHRYVVFRRPWRVQLGSPRAFDRAESASCS